MPQGVLYLIVGPSGAGKADLIEAARRKLAEDDAFVFPRRIITRSDSMGGGEIHQAVTPAQYDRLRRDHGFSLTWSAYGANYALPASIYDDLDAGRNVVAMVSRTVVEEARSKFSSVEVILVTASRPLRRRRLAARGEALDLIVTRLDRDALPVAADHRLQTDGGIEAALPRLMSILREGRFSQPTGRRRSMLTGMAAANLR